MSDYIANFTARVMQDALSEATAAYWRRRAAQLRDAVTPRPNDFLGIDPDAAQHRLERRRRALAFADACELKARVFEAGDPPGVEIWEAIAELEGVSR